MNMERTRSRSSSSSSVYIPFSLQHLCVLALFVLILHCDARKLPEILSSSRTTKTVKRFDVYLPLDSSNSNSEPYGVSSPFNLPPYDSLAPIPLPENSPPYCLYPPPFPPVLPPPSTTVPSPGGAGGYILSPPMPRSPPQIVPSPTEPVLSPPQFVPSPTEPVLSPPQYVPSPTEPILSPPQLVPSPIEPVLSPPRYEPSPPASVPPPTGHLPSPFLPPVVYPPPTVPPPPSTTPPTALWCVAKPAVPEPIIQEAMNYACASGADCNQIQPNGSCFQPDTLFAHASYAFNSYWQRTKEAGGTCEFGSTAMLVTVDPSYDGCHFTYL